MNSEEFQRAASMAVQTQHEDLQDQMNDLANAEKAIKDIDERLKTIKNTYYGVVSDRNKICNNIECYKQKFKDLLTGSSNLGSGTFTLYGDRHAYLYKN
jgi:SMC interacting uncharacterized protein involved in chromosome segregation